MIYINTTIRSVDNTGIRVVYCVKIYKRNKAKLKDIILVSVRKIRPNLKLRKLKKQLATGQIWRALVLKNRQNIIKVGSHFVQFKRCGVLMLRGDGEMAGSRIYGPVPREFYNKKYFSVCSYVI